MSAFCAGARRAAAGAAACDTTFEYQPSVPSQPLHISWALDAKKYAVNGLMLPVAAWLSDARLMLMLVPSTLTVTGSPGSCGAPASGIMSRSWAARSKVLVKVPRTSPGDGVACGGTGCGATVKPPKSKRTSRPETVTGT